MYGQNGTTLEKVTIDYLKEIKVCFLDLDGTLYHSDVWIDGALEFLEHLKEREIFTFFLSNNTSRTKQDYLDKFSKMGLFGVEADQVIHPLDEVVPYLIDQKLTHTYTLANPPILKALTQQGIQTSAAHPEVVLLCFDQTIDYQKMTQAGRLLHQGVPLIATHSDTNCPTSAGPMPDVGSFLALFKAAYHVTPLKIFGKPHTNLLQQKIDVLGIQPQQTLLIGDRLHTDIALAQKVGCVSILVLTGEASLQDVAVSPFQPTFVLDNLLHPN